ncbi:pupal cuticle protein 20-like [Adelges cooleyi]|uniref:pupal cuticle protein 20-like n=1 Tax=Adelges cooleyi TaxID=133065 RepID=UPI0021801AEC|nr:pupal cuticle protein 20-like [Adelges cooleyi]
MNTLVVLVAIVAMVAAAPQKPFEFNNGLYQGNQAYYPGQQGYYPGYSGYRGYYPGYQGYAGYPGYQGYQGYAGYPGYQGYQGYNGYNRGYYPGYQAPAPLLKVNAIPTPAPIYKSVDNKLPAIISQSQEVNPDGSFKYGYKTENGIESQAVGYVKNPGTEGAAQVIEGSYAYQGDDGVPVEVRYYADESGYHAFGNVIPTTPPEIAKSLELNAQEAAKPQLEISK